jgi:5-(carboxyamino)imidazole ribonucleotide synthase
MSAILPPATLGMLGGGQLGRFFVQAAQELGYRVWVLDPDPGSPAGRLADRHLAAGYEDTAALDELARHCAAVSTEFENVPAASLERLAATVTVHPAAAAVAPCQDRLAEKAFLAEHGLPHGPCAPVRSESDLDQAGPELFPGILKAARLGYDGKGQAEVADVAAAREAFQRFGGVPCILEARLPLDCEISVVLARDASGHVQAFPAAENRHRRGILDVSIVPARVSVALEREARQCAERIAIGLDYVGVLGVEFFVSRGKLLVNEMAPRPHNSGHYTLDACITSQYEQQVRALCGLPLGHPAAISAAVMVNLLGDLWFEDGKRREPDWSRLLAVPELKLHLYGKQEPRPGRKMGHFTLLDPDPDRALVRALAARLAIGIRDG